MSEQVFGSVLKAIYFIQGNKRVQSLPKILFNRKYRNQCFHPFLLDFQIPISGSNLAARLEEVKKTNCEFELKETLIVFWMVSVLVLVNQ